MAERSKKATKNTKTAASKSSPGRSRLPFRRKMDLLVFLPIVAMAGLLVPISVHETTAARQWSAAADYLSSTKSVSQLLQDLSIEHDKAQAAGQDPTAAPDYTKAINDTDTQVQNVARAFGHHASPTLSAALAAVGDLAFVREQAVPASHDYSHLDRQAASQALIDSVYGAIEAQLVNALDFAGHATEAGPASSLETELAALYAGDLAESQREAALAEFAAASKPVNAAAQFVTANRTVDLAKGELGFVLQFPSAADRAALSAELGSDESRYFDEYQQRFDEVVGGAFGDPRGILRTVDLDTIRTKQDRDTLTADFVTLSNRRTQVEAQITDRIIALAHQNTGKAILTAGGLVGGGIVASIVLLSMSALIRRSVVRPVMALTNAASRVARAAAADLERVTDEDPGERGELPQFEALPIQTDDELGDLARAFNHVQETALLVLERQITIRRNTAEMFGNVGHRIHNLTGRQLAIIDQVERTETDPVLLDRLYRIDHLAVRLQRGADSLILLSGEREANLSGAPMRLTDVVRSAVGRVEGYQRVVLIAEDDAMVAPAAISDLTLMIAELVENAVAFSPASSRVEIAVGLTARGFVVEIVDRGMGMSPEQLAQENARLVRRERLDLAPTRVLGLFVVGRLSVRTGAAVELSPTAGGGTTARIYVPGFLLAGPTTETLPQRAPRGDGAESAALPPGVPGLPALDGSGADGGALPMRRPGAFGMPALESSESGLPTRTPGAAQPYDLSSPSESALPVRLPGAAAPISALDSSNSYQLPSSPQASNDGTPLQVSGLDALALPGPNPNGGPPYSLHPLAPLPPPGPEGLGRRRARNQPVPHQPVPEPRRDSEGLPQRRTLQPGAALSAPPPQEASPLAQPQPSQPEPVPPPYGVPAGVGNSATAPKPADNALPRRVRKAVPQPEWPPAAPLSAVTGPLPPQDAVAVRDALEEYEAGVQQALRDSADDLPARSRQGARHAGPAAPARDGEDD